jgi:signal transduction histidine kinase
MRLTIRKKLFLAFFIVVLAPVAGFAVLAFEHARQLKRDLSEQFVGEAREAFKERIEEVFKTRTFFFDHTKALALNLRSCASTDCYAAAIHRHLAESWADKGAFIRSGDAIAYSTYPAGTTLPSWPPVVVTGTTDPDDFDAVRAAAENTPYGLLKVWFPELNLDRVRSTIDANGREWMVEAIPPDLKVEGALHGRDGAVAVVLGKMTPAHSEPPRWLFVELDAQPLLTSKDFLSHRVTAFAGDDVSPGLPQEFADLRLPDLARQLPPHGERGTVVGKSGQRFIVYSALAMENAAWTELRNKAEEFAAVPEDELFAPVRALQRTALLASVAFIAFALLVATLMSRRFVGAIDRLRTGVQAIGRGEWVTLDRASQDELGGELVEAVNRLAGELAERGRREELDNWKRVIRVLSHEINNTIAPVRSVASTLRDQIGRRVDGGEDLRQASSFISDRVDALGKFVARFGELARLPPPDRHPLDLSGLVRSAVRMFTEDARERQITLHVEAASVTVTADPGQLERVIINLLKNAVEASPNGGTVTARVTEAGGAAHIEVEDHGPGISPEARRNLFVPSFSTKPGGSGVGLALARQIVVGHRGWITADEREGGGTTFRVLLPIGERDALASPYRSG